jgi:hypothetical protein
MAPVAPEVEDRQALAWSDAQGARKPTAITRNRLRPIGAKATVVLMQVTEAPISQSVAG